MRKWYEMKMAKDKSGVAEILIYDVIGQSYWGEETVNAKDFDKDLKALGDISEIRLRINSPGGDVIEGTAIYNMLAAHPAKKMVQIDGIAASMASYIAMVGDEITAPENTYMLIHEPYGFAFGTSEDILARAGDLERMTETAKAVYAKRSKQNPEAVATLMKEDRLMTAKEALELGYIDSVKEPVKLAASAVKFAPQGMSALPPKSRDAWAKVIEKAEKDATAQQTQPKPDNVVDLNAHKGDGEAYAMEVMELCDLAGFPEKARGFVAAKTAIPEIRKQLVNAKAEKQQDEISGQHPNRTNSNAPKASWDSAVEKVNARVR